MTKYLFVALHPGKESMDPFVKRGITNFATTDFDGSNPSHTSPKGKMYSVDDFRAIATLILKKAYKESENAYDLDGVESKLHEISYVSTESTPAQLERLTPTEVFEMLKRLITKTVEAEVKVTSPESGESKESTITTHQLPTITAHQLLSEGDNKQWLYYLMAATEIKSEDKAFLYGEYNYTESGKARWMLEPFLKLKDKSFLDKNIQIVIFGSPKATPCIDVLKLRLGGENHTIKNLTMQEISEQYLVIPGTNFRDKDYSLIKPTRSTIRSKNAQALVSPGAKPKNSMRPVRPRPQRAQSLHLVEPKEGEVKEAQSLHFESKEDEVKAPAKKPRTGGGRRNVGTKHDRTKSHILPQAPLPLEQNEGQVAESPDSAEQNVVHDHRPLLSVDVDVPPTPLASSAPIDPGTSHSAPAVLTGRPDPLTNKGQGPGLPFGTIHEEASSDSSESSPSESSADESPASAAGGVTVDTSSQQPKEGPASLVTPGTSSSDGSTPPPSVPRRDSDSDTESKPFLLTGSSLFNKSTSPKSDGKKSEDIQPESPRPKGSNGS